KGNTTLGSQSRLEEGHYVHHFSVNPKNIEDDVKRINAEGLTQGDIDKLKEGLRKGASYYDSAAKAGTENELLFWIQLKEGSKMVMPSFIEFVDINEEGVIDLAKVEEYLSQKHIKNEIEAVEIFYNGSVTQVENIPEAAVFETI
ncbi:MAG: type I CRISPR-associated protein Cas7, partial [Phycisphaerae bacterium]